MEGFCRGCLNKHDDPSEILHYTEKNRRLYVYSTGLQVKRNDVFPFQLCKECYVNMKMACRFKKQCRNSEKKFRNYLALKETEDCGDFSSYLKTLDDSFSFRFPLMGPGSIPPYKTKDDDNESTCTSIRNFMTDILRADDIPDTEARIIREVIEEEADVLDESLDSHWLQDDVSIDTDFKLDFNYSPFSTPRTTNGDQGHASLKKLIESQSPVKNFNETSQEIQCYAAAKEILKNTDQHFLTENLNRSEQENNELSQEIYHNNDLKEEQIPVDVHERIRLEKEKILAVQSIIQDYHLDNKEEIEIIEADGEREPTQIDSKIQRNSISNKSHQIPIDAHERIRLEKEKELAVQSIIQDYNLDNKEEIEIIEAESEREPTQIEKDLKNKAQENYSKKGYYMEVDADNDQVINTNEGKHDYTIDNNLGKVLKDEEIKEFPLDSLLLTPRVEHGATTPLTPTIKSILFGDNVPGQVIENFDNVQGEDDENILEEFFKESSDDNQCDVKVKIEPIDEIELDSENKRNDNKEVEYNLDDCKCLTCDKKFRSLQAIKIHLTKIHKLRLEVQRINSKVDKICDECGKRFLDNSNYTRHLKIHKKIREHECKYCKQKFSSESKLKMHMNVHGEKKETKTTVLTALLFYASGSYQKPVGVEKNLCQKACSNFIEQVTEALTNRKILDKYIKFPDNTQARQTISQRFYSKYKMPGVIGCIDCSHFKIISPPKEEEQHYCRRSFHSLNVQMNHICPTCGKSCSTEEGLKIHLKRHNSEFRFHCQHCEKKFFRSSDLTNHMRAHTGEKPFVCPKCPYRAARRDTINKHLKRHIDERKFKCQFCKSAFVTAKDLKNHHDKAKQCRKKQMHIALLERDKDNEFIVEETKAFVIHDAKIDNQEGAIVEKDIETEELVEEKVGDIGDLNVEDLREIDEKTEVSDCKITDLMSIPTIEENDSDLELPDDSSINLQDEINQLSSPIHTSY